MKRILTLTLVLTFALVLLPGCGDNNSNDADSQVARKTAQQMSEAQSQVGLPAIVNWQEMKLVKYLYEQRDRQDLVCYAYLVNVMTADQVFIGKCIGYGVPYCVQFSNPERVVDFEKVGAISDLAGRGPVGKLPQPEPNGLFMPQTLSATWLMMINPKTGKQHPVYIEPQIIVSPFMLPGAIGNPEH